MPLGHVAVVSRVLDARHILLRHANWSSPGQIEEDVMAIDSSDAGDWSQIRIWWGQGQQMGARDNPVNGFIYPAQPTPEDVPARHWLFASASGASRNSAPHLNLDKTIYGSGRDTVVSAARPDRWRTSSRT